MSLVHGCPIHTIIFLCSVDRENGVKTYNFGIKIRKIKLKGTFVLSFKLIGLHIHQKLPEAGRMTTEEWTHRLEYIMPINGA